MDRRWKILEKNRVAERKESPAAINVRARKMHAMRDVQRKRRKSMWNERQGRNQWVINEKLGEWNEK